MEKEQMMAHLQAEIRTNREEMLAKIDANKENMDAKMEANQEIMVDLKTHIGCLAPPPPN
jgi:hypothetical protein